MSVRRKFLLYAVFTVAAFGAGLVLTFPYDVLGRRLEAEAARALPQSTLVIGEVGPALPLGLRLGRIVLARGGGAEKLELDRVRIRPSLLRLLALKPAIDFDVRAFSGEARGRVVAGAAPSLDLRVDGMRLEGASLLRQLTGLQLAGELSGRARLSLDGSGAITDGQIEATVASLQLAGGTVAGFSVPALDLGSPELDVSVEQGVARIGRLATRSPDGTVDVSGEISLKPVLGHSPIKGRAAIRLEDAWLNRNPTVKGLLGFAGGWRKPDGSLEIPLDGPLNRPARLPFPGGGMAPPRF